MNARMFAMAIAFIALHAAEAAGEHSLHGRVMNDATTPSTPVVSASVRLTSARRETTTDSHGDFFLSLPDSYRGGEQVLLELKASKGGKALLFFQPLDGQVRIPADLDKDMVTVEVLPEGSLRFKSDETIRAMLSLANSQGENKATQLSRMGPVAQFDLENFIQEWAKGHGLEPSDLVARVKDWADKVRADATSGLEEKALAAFAHEDFAQAGGLFSDAANANRREEAELKKSIAQQQQRLVQVHMRAIYDSEQSASSHQKAALYQQVVDDCREALADIDPKSDRFFWQWFKTMEGTAHQMFAYTHFGPISDEHFKLAIKDFQDVVNAFPGQEEAFRRMNAEMQLAEVMYMAAENKTGAEADNLRQQAREKEKHNLAIYSRDDDPGIWAQGQLNIAYMDLDSSARSGLKEAHQLLDDAQQAIDRAKEINTRNRMPLQWAQTQQIYGQILFARALMSDPDKARPLIHEAEDVFQSAQEELAKAGIPNVPNQLLLCQVWMADAALSTADRRLELLNKALDLLKKLSVASSREREPRVWANVEASLSQVRMELTQFGPPSQRNELFTQAVIDGTRSLDTIIRESSPGIFDDALAEIMSLLEHLAEANTPDEQARAVAKVEDAIQRTLRRIKKEEAPREWASLKVGLGNMLLAEGPQGEATQAKDQINRALQAFRDATDIFTRDSSLAMWAQLRLDMGRSLGMLSSMSEAAEALKLLDDAEAAFEDVLRAVNREEMPQLWAQAQIGLGQVLMDRWQRNPGQQDRTQLQKAEQAERSALEVLRLDRDSGIWLQGEQNLFVILMTEAGDNSDQSRKNLQQALDVCQAILHAWPKDQAPELWAQTQASQGDAASRLAMISNAQDASNLLDQAIHAYKEAQQFFTREANLDTWGRLQSNLAGTKLDLAERSEPEVRRKLALEAAEIYERLLGTLNPQTNPSQWGWAEMELGRARMVEAEADPASARPLLDKSIELSRKTLDAIRKEQDPTVWEKAQFNLGQALEDEAQLARPDGSPSLSRQAADAFGAVLEIDPHDNNARARLSSILQDELFEYEKAFAVSSAYANAVQGDYDAELDFIEVHLTTGRFEECLHRSARLRTDADLTPSGRVILGVLEIVCNLGLQNRDAANAKFGEIDHLLGSPDFQKALPNWSFKGTKHFVDTSPAFAEYKHPLMPLLDALESGDIEAIRRNLKPVGASLARAPLKSAPEK